MEATSRTLEPVVIEQDEASKLHVQPAIQSGRRQIDIRLWRRGPGGFAPSRNALTVDAPDLVALHEGISELLAASNQGQQVARVVWDRDEGRRLRAETEPFGTRFTARLGFWQRVRDTWRPADDGLVIAAHLLQPLLDVLTSMRADFLEAAERDLLRPTVRFDPEQEQRWPSPGADWITLEPDRIAFHPRGVRITATVETESGEPRLALQQWRREESIWLREGEWLSLSLTDVDALLSRLRGEQVDPTPLYREDATTIRLRMEGETPGDRLTIEEEQGGAWASRVEVPAEYISRVGRLLAQCGALLVMHLTPGEREALLERPDGPAVSADIVDDALVIVHPDPEPEPELAVPEADSDGEASLDSPDVTEREPVEAGPQRRTAQFGQLHLGQQEITVRAYLEDEEPLYLAFHWEGGSLALPVVHVPRMIEDLRNLYYDALRGRRGHVSTVPGSPATHMSIHSHGAGIFVMLDQESGDKMVTLVFPVREVPAFLNAADSALIRIRRGEF